MKKSTNIVFLILVLILCAVSLIDMMDYRPKPRMLPFGIICILALLCIWEMISSWKQSNQQKGQNQPSSIGNQSNRKNHIVIGFSIVVLCAAAFLTTYISYLITFPLVAFVLIKFVGKAKIWNALAVSAGSFIVLYFIFEKLIA